RRRARACCQVWRTLLHANDFAPAERPAGRRRGGGPSPEYSRIGRGGVKTGRDGEQGGLVAGFERCSEGLSGRAGKSSGRRKKVLFYRKFPERSAQHRVI